MSEREAFGASQGARGHIIDEFVVANFILD